MMKANKSPGDTVITPSKKKLKQARLPFKLISDEPSPPPRSPETKKRKLLLPEAEIVPKVVKISKENDLIKNDVVVISDEDSKDSENTNKKCVILPNPYVKLVDTAWKKKLKKSKKNHTVKKRLTKDNTSSILNSSNESITDSSNKQIEDEKMEVDISNEEIIDSGMENDMTQAKEEFNNKIVKESAKHVNSKNEIAIPLLEDSNNTSDIKHSDCVDNDSLQCKQTEADTENNLQCKNQENNSENENQTPKRITRKRVIDEEEKNLNLSTSSAQLDDSVVSDVTTPKQSSGKSSDVANLDDSLNSSVTPKQLQKKMGSAKKREEKEKERQEREKKRQHEKEERAKQKQEKEEQRKREKEHREESRRKEKEEKEEQKKKEREEKERQKELEKKLKEEKEDQKRKEKEEKEEQKRKEKEAKEEERRKKQEALEQEKLEQELKKKKAAEAFVNFFVPKQKEKDQTTVDIVSKNNMLSSFTIKADMRLAPLNRVTFDEDKKEKLDNLLEEQNSTKDLLYLQCLKTGTKKPGNTGKTWPLSDKNVDDDVMIIEDELPPVDGTEETIACEPEVREKMRAKLLSFHDNRRPPYWGTWRKRSKFIGPRRPFRQDEKQLDYEVESDDEWEEEQEGESLDGSVAGSDDEQGPDEYEVDNELFVPHGYLSDEEATMDEDDVLSLSPETQKARLKHLEDEFESELKKPTEKLKPRLYGLLWVNSDGGKPQNCVDSLWNYFGKFSMILNDPTPLLQPPNEAEDTEKKKSRKRKQVIECEQSPKNNKKAKHENKNVVNPIEVKRSTPEVKKISVDMKKNQPTINTFLTKKKT